MKKGLLVTVVLLAVALVFTGCAFAADTTITTSGTIEFKITGTDAKGEASGLFAAGDVYVDYEVVGTSGDWEINISPEFDVVGGALTECDSYIKYSGEGMSLTLDPVGIDYDLWDVAGNEGTPAIPDNSGIALDLDMEPLALNLVVNNQAVGDETKYNFGAGISYSASPVTVDIGMGTTPVETATWYGTFYGISLTADMAPITLIGEYGTFSPETSGLKEGSGYYVELDYDLPEGGGSLGACYNGADEALNGAGTKTADKYSYVEGWYTYPITDDVSLTFDVASEDTGLAGAKSVTSYYAKVSASL